MWLKGFFISVCVISLSLLCLCSCRQEDQQNYSPTFSPNSPNKISEYIFGVHPLHNPQRLFEIFAPLMDYLSSRISGVQFKLEASRNYAAYDEKLYSRHFHFALPNPYQTINAIDIGYRVFAKMGDDQNFRGIILVRKDSNIREISDLKGKSVSYPAPTALAATMMPQYYIQSHGVDVLNDLDNRYVGSQESSIMNVFLGKVDAGVTWPPPWFVFSKERPEIAEQLEVKWQTDSLPNNSLVVLPGVQQEIVKQVQQLFVGLHHTVEGTQILESMGLSRFEVATDVTYDPVRVFVAQFAEKVRPLNLKSSP